MNARSVISCCIFLAACFISSVASAQVDINLTGRWSANDGGTYQLRHVGTELWWYGQSSDGGATWSNVYHGTIRGNQVSGRWADVPPGRIQNAGVMDLVINNANQITATNRTGGFGGSVWTRQGATVTPPPKPGGNFVQRCADNSTFVTSLYQSILKRAPDSGGHGYWVNALQNGMTREQATTGFLESAEYRGFSRNNGDYARDLYHGVLGREPEAEGHNYWIRAMNDGMSRAEVLRRFFASPEYQGIVAKCGASR